MGRDEARASRSENRRERSLYPVCAFMYLLAGCAFVVAGTFTFRFLFLTSFRRGALLSLALYAAVAAAAWLAGRSGPDF